MKTIDETTVLSQGGATRYAVTLAADAAPAEKSAAAELVLYLGKVTGATFSVVTPAETGGQPVIAVGPGAARAVASALALSKTELGDDGIVIKTVGHNLVLTGGVGAKRGTLYAVYEFLESAVGVRWWTSSEEFVPSRPELTIRRLDVRYVPPFLYREVYSWDMVYKEYQWGYDDSDAAVKDWGRAKFAARLRNNGHATAMPASFGGCYMPIGWCHTLYRLLPPDRYFKEHPEWYGKIDGKRTCKSMLGTNEIDGQLCMTNDEMLRELSKNVLEKIREQPALGIIAVSQSDCSKGCQCAKCKALDDAEGSPSASLLYGVNRVAEEVEKEFPEFYVETLAYQYTRKPPKTMRPRRNVLMQVCMDTRSYFQPIESEQNVEMADCLKGWSSIGAKLMIWNYSENYSGPLAPHPNLHTVGPDLRTWRDNHAIGVFFEDETLPTSYFYALRTYLVAHLLWDPSRDEQVIIDEFLNGYYGKGGPSLRQVVDMFETAAGHVTLRVWPGSADASWANLTTMNRATRLFREAEAAVADNPTVLARIKRARIPLEHQWLYNYQNYRVQGALPGNLFLGPDDPARAAAEFKARVLDESSAMPDHPFKSWFKPGMDEIYLDALAQRAAQKSK